LNKVQFDSMTFQERNGTCGMEPERFGRNLAEKSGTDRDLKWDEICSVLFYFLNWYGMFRPFRAERNGIDNLAHTTHTHTHTHLICKLNFYSAPAGFQKPWLYLLYCFFFRNKRKMGILWHSGWLLLFTKSFRE
jgi:hypothetical protein